MKLFISLIITITLSLLLTSCENPDKANSYTGAENNTEYNTANKAGSDMWSVELISYEIAENLLTSQAAMGYGGGVVVTENTVEPSYGNVFLLLELSIEKTGQGRASFSWNDVHIIDSAGNTYYRHPNDSFLSNLNIPRIRGTDIVLGNEQGFVCFEISQAAAGLRFIADEGSIDIRIN